MNDKLDIKIHVGDILLVPVKQGSSGASLEYRKVLALEGKRAKVQSVDTWGNLKRAAWMTKFDECLVVSSAYVTPEALKAFEDEKKPTKKDEGVPGIWTPGYFE